MKFEIIPHPHLPTGKVHHIACGHLTDEMHYSLLQHVNEVITVNPQPAIDKSLQSHTDLCLCPLPDRKIFLSDSQLSLKEKLISLGFCVIMQENIKSPYPNDCLLNFVDTCYYTICNKSVHKTVIVDNRTKMVINVKQGYIKCSVVPVAENAIITDDPSVAKNADFAGMDVCFVQKGDVRLDGYPYGFIGGCCGKLSAHTVAFCGNIKYHRDCNKILDFLKRYDITAVCLADTQLTDVGSLIPLTQEKG